MISKILPTIIVSALLSGNAALAQTTELKPGLWDMTSLLDGKPALTMLSDMPPDMPKNMMEMIRKTMRADGVELTKTGLQICVNKTNMNRAYGNIGPCKQNIEWDGDIGTLTMVCQGEPDHTGTIEILSDTQWQSEIPTTNAETGVPQTAVSKGKWVGADCKGLPPIK